MVTKEITKEELEILKKINFYEQSDNVIIDEKNMTFSFSERKVAIIFNLEIVDKGLDKDYNCTELGKKMYKLYDKLFLDR